MSSYPHVVVTSVTEQPSRHRVASSVSSAAVEESCVCASIVHAECGSRFEISQLNLTN